MQQNLSFDEMMELARTAPDELERYRQQQVEALIGEAPPYLRQRLQGLQFQIDAQRQLHQSPIGACVKLSQMMHSSFDKLQRVLHEFNDLSLSANNGVHRTRVYPVTHGKLLPFPVAAARKRAPAPESPV